MDVGPVGSVGLKALTDRRLGREAAAVVVGQAAGALGLLAAVRVLTHLLSPAEYGAFALAMTFAPLASQVLLGPLANAALRFYPVAREEGRVAVFWKSVTRLGLAVSILAAGVGLAAVLVLHLIDARIGALVGGLSVAFAILSGWETIFDALQNAQRRRWLVAVHQGLRQWLRPALAALALGWLGGGVPAALTSYVLASGVVLASQMLVNPQRATGALFGHPCAYVPRLALYALPFAGWGAFTWLQLASDRWALELTADARTVAMYVVLFQLGAQPLVLLGTAAAQLVEPLVYARAGSGIDAARVRSAVVLNTRLVAATGVLVAGVVIVQWLAHALIFRVLVAPEYQASSVLLPLAGASGGLFALGQLVGLGSVVLGSSRLLLAPKIGCAILGTGLNVAGAYWLGVGGVIAAGLVTAAVYFAWTIVLSVRRMRQLNA